jgi:hypothetical protein
MSKDFKELNIEFEKMFNPPFYIKIFRKIRRFVDNVNSLLHWIPIIWKNHEWDYSYLLELLVYKLDKMEVYFALEGMSTCSYISANQIAEVKRLLKRVKEDNYREEVENEFHFEEKYGELAMDFGEKDENDCRRAMFSFVKDGEKISNELKEEADKVYLEMMKIADKRRKKECEKAFKIISKAIFNWWD